jgi:hypothetical protein
MSEPQSALLLRKQLAGKPSKEYFSHTKNQHNYKKSDTPRRHQTTPKSPHSRGISPKTPRQLDPAPASSGQKRRNPKKSAPGTEPRPAAVGGGAWGPPSGGSTPTLAFSVFTQLSKKIWHLRRYKAIFASETCGIAAPGGPTPRGRSKSVDFERPAPAPSAPKPSLFNPRPMTLRLCYFNNEVLVRFQN